METLANEFQNVETGIVVLPEGSFDGIFAELINFSIDHKVVIVSSLSTGTNIDIVFILKNGLLKPSGIYYGDDLSLSENIAAYRLFQRLNIPHNVSPTKDPVLAITKSCADIYKPLREGQVVDLVLLPASLDYTSTSTARDLLINKNRRNISNKTLFAQSVAGDVAGTGIFRLPDFERLGEARGNYTVYNWSRH